MKHRVTATARKLGVHPITLRRWVKDGKVTPEYSAAGQMVFSDEYIDSILRENNPENDNRKVVFYCRVSGKNDSSLVNQENLLVKRYGTPNEVFKDTASGLKENRKGLSKMLGQVRNDEIKEVIITHKDRLSRFGTEYIKHIFEDHDTKLTIMSEKTDEPHEILMQDFMSLIASFSGRFYSLRGKEQKRKLLHKAEKELNNGEENT